MFAQANSEHCRHKIFNARWIIDGTARAETLFAMIRYTHERNPAGVLSAYQDNAAVIEGSAGRALLPRPALGHLSREPRADRHRDQGRDAQPSHRHLALPGGRHRLGRGDPRRGRHRPRRQAQGGADGLLGLEPAHSGLRASLGARLRQARRASPRRSRSCSKVRSARPRSTTSSAGPAICGYFRTFEQPAAGDPPRARARLSQADHDRRRPGQRAPLPGAQGRGARGRQARGARRSGDAHRPRRRGGLLGGQRRLRCGAGFCLRAARQPRDPAARAGSDRSLLGARRPQPHHPHPRRRRRWALQRGAGGGRAQRARRAHRSAHHPERRARHVAAGAVVQRGAGALRARDRGEGAGRIQRHRGARALPVRRHRRDRRLRAAAGA